MTAAWARWKGKHSMERQSRRRSGYRAPMVWLAILMACYAVGAARAAGSGWQQLTLPTPKPLARFGHSLSTVIGVPLMYAGSTPSLTGPGNVALTDLWQFVPSTSSFVRLNGITGSPPPRTGHAAAAL